MSPGAKGLKMQHDLLNHKVTMHKYNQLRKQYRRQKILNRNRKLQAKTNFELNSLKFMKCLSPKQKLVIEHFLKFSKSKGKTIIYNKQWILECIIMKIKSAKLYQYLRMYKILILPSISLLNKRIKHIRYGFGINPKTMMLIKEKTQHMEKYQLHGNLLIDELKLRESIKLNKSTGHIGLVDLGPFCTEKTDRKSDHGLIILFQPYASEWKQVIAVYSSRGNVNGDLLHKIILNAVICSENAGLFVDGVTCDGASWNRKMFSCFGIGSKKGEIVYKAPHPCDSKRSLYFFSDFPHLIKCVRNRFIKEKHFETQYGTINFDIISTAVKLDSSLVKLKAMPGIGTQHVCPDNFQKMKVSLAMQLFGPSVQTGIKVYRNELEKLYGVHAVNVLEEFIVRFHNIIDIMTSHFIAEALFVNSRKMDDLSDFMTYLCDWEAHSQKCNCKGFLTPQTSEGLKITLLSVLALLQYLAKEVGFKYLLTSRVSQDALENFFGVIRAFSPNNDHPTPTEFLSVVEILAFCSIIKTPTTGNCGPMDFTSFLTYSDYQCLKGNEVHKHIPHNSEVEVGDRVTEGSVSNTDHDYLCKSSHPALNSYFSGYIARKFIASTDCNECVSSLQDNFISNDSNWLILEKDYGGLIYPSSALRDLISELDSIFVGFAGKEGINRYSYLNLINICNMSTIHSKVGCQSHTSDFSNKIIAFVLMCRMAFHIRQINAETHDNKRKFIKFGKMRKLQ